MFIDCLLCIDIGGHKSFIDFFCHFREEKKTLRREEKKNVCQVAMPNGSVFIWIKGIHKAC
jgi:hypothetical protein